MQLLPTCSSGLRVYTLCTSGGMYCYEERASVNGRKKMEAGGDFWYGRGRLQYRSVILVVKYVDVSGSSVFFYY